MCQGLFDVCIAPEKVVGVVGCLSSDCTLSTASFFTPLRTPVISYAASSPDLDDRVNHPYFLRTVPSDEEQAIAMTKVGRHFLGWVTLADRQLFSCFRGVRGASLRAVACDQGNVPN